MPELPEVETVKRDLQKRLVGVIFRQVFVFDDRVLSVRNSKAFCKNLSGCTVVEVIRRAKLIIIKFKDEGYLLVHLKMTGQLIYGENLKAQGLKDTKVVFELSNGSFLNFNDQRMFGKLTFVKNLDKVSFLQKVGPEPLESGFNSDWLKSNIKKRTAPIKTLMLNQHFVAGIGNIYASEILFQAKIRPTRQANKLTSKEMQAFCASTRNILTTAIKYRGTSMRNYRDSEGKKGEFNQHIKVYGKAGEPCPKCQTPIIRIVQTMRSTFYCKKCQK